MRKLTVIAGGRVLTVEPCPVCGEAEWGESFHVISILPPSLREVYRVQCPCFRGDKGGYSTTYKRAMSEWHRRCAWEKKRLKSGLPTRAFIMENTQ